MLIEFSKYQGTGNDFVLIDNRNQLINPNNTELIKNLCNRRFGIGADGLMLLENERSYDFRMRYFNSDGKEASMCGNGGRCIVAFAYQLGIVSNTIHFIAVDGIHDAKIEITNGQQNIMLKMSNVSQIEKGTDYYFLNTGSPHFVKFISNHADFDTHAEGKKIRFNDRFAKEGTNVNFVSFANDHLIVSTYERGVEDETFSCGTGVVASAIAASFVNDKKQFSIQTKGGILNVSFDKADANTIKNIWLTGPAIHVFDGKIKI